MTFYNIDRSCKVIIFLKGWALLSTNYERLGLLLLGCSPGGAASNFWVKILNLPLFKRKWDRIHLFSLINNYEIKRFLIKEFFVVIKFWSHDLMDNHVYYITFDTELPTNDMRVQRRLYVIYSVLILILMVLCRCKLSSFFTKPISLSFIS